MFNRIQGPTSPSVDHPRPTPLRAVAPLRRLYATAAALTMWPAPVWAAQPEVEVCLTAHEEAHVHRDEGDMLATRAALRQCSASTCPALVQRDCIEWLAEVERSIPTVVVEVTLDGAAGEPSEFWLDGVAMPVPTEAIELNPGTHVFRATAIIDGKTWTREQSVLVQPSIRRQQVQLDIAPDAPPTANDAVAAPTGDGGRRLRVAGFSLLGTGVAAGVSTLGLGVSAIVDHGKMEDECAPFCDADEARGVQSRFVAADVLGAVSGALLVTSVVLLAIGYKQKRQATASRRTQGEKSTASRTIAPTLSPAHAGIQIRW